MSKKFGQDWTSNRWAIALLIPTNVSTAYILHGQMSFWHLASFNYGPKILSLNFGQDQVGNSWDVPEMDKNCLDKCHRTIYVMAIFPYIISIWIFRYAPTGIYFCCQMWKDNLFQLILSLTHLCFLIFFLLNWFLKLLTIPHNSREEPDK